MASAPPWSTHRRPDLLAALPAPRTTALLATASPPYILDLATTPAHVLAAASDGLVRVHDRDSLALLHAWSPHQGAAVAQVRVCGSDVWTCAGDRVVRRWDTRAGTHAPVASLGGAHSEPCLVADVDASGNMLAIGTAMTHRGSDDGPDAAILFHDLRHASAASAPLADFTQTHGDDVTHLRFHPHRPDTLLSASEDALCCVLRVTPDTLRDEYEATVAVHNAHAPISQIGWFGPHAEFVWSLTRVETLALWKTADAELIYDYGDMRRACFPVLDTAPAPRIDYLVGCHYDALHQRLYAIAGDFAGTLHAIHLNIGDVQLCQSWQGHGPAGTGHIDMVRAFDGDLAQGLLYTGGEDGRLCQWSAEPAPPTHSAVTLVPTAKAPSSPSGPHHPKKPRGSPYAKQ